MRPTKKSPLPIALALMIACSWTGALETPGVEPVMDEPGAVSPRLVESRFDDAASSGSLLDNSGVSIGPDAELPEPGEDPAEAQSIRGFLRRAEKSVRTKNFDELEDLLRDQTLVPIVEKGGPIMIPLLIASVLALGTVLDRLVFLLNEWRKRDRKNLERFLNAITRQDLAAARAISANSKDFVVRVLAYGLERPKGSITSALTFAQEREIKRFRQGIPVLDTIITLAPLLGLLGTVTGMMGSFSLIGGELGAPGAITGGIAEALIATAYGLGIAITCLIPFNFLNNKLEQAQLEIETAASRMLTMMGVRDSSRAGE